MGFMSARGRLQRYTDGYTDRETKAFLPDLPHEDVDWDPCDIFHRDVGLFFPRA